MADPRFFKNFGPFRLSDLAEIGGATLHGDVDGDMLIRDVAALDAAGEGEISFLDNMRYTKQFEMTKASACVVAEKLVSRAPEGVALLVTTNPYKSFALISQAFYPRPRPEPGKHPGAWVDETAKIGEGCQIGPGAVISAGVDLGARAIVGPNSVIAENVVIGDDCRIGANVTLSHCLIGDRVNILPGARIGQDGFGFAPDPAGHIRVPQVGRVVIGNDVEIGANTTIDRGAGPDTMIGDGTWIDNLVQIGHNARVGRGCIIVSQVGISGSTEVGDFVAVGGQAGMAGHLKIGAGAQIAAKSGLMTDVPAGQTFAGSPAQPIKEHFRQVAVLKKMAKEKGTKK